MIITGTGHEGGRHLDIEGNNSDKSSSRNESNESTR